MVFIVVFGFRFEKKRFKDSNIWLLVVFVAVRSG